MPTIFIPGVNLARERIMELRLPAPIAPGRTGLTAAWRCRRRE